MGRSAHAFGVRKPGQVSEGKSESARLHRSGPSYGRIATTRGPTPSAAAHPPPSPNASSTEHPHRRTRCSARNATAVVVKSVHDQPARARGLAADGAAGKEADGFAQQPVLD